MARLLSVNVGLARYVSWRGEKVLTSLWKAPAQGSRMVRRLKADGDGQGDLAGHGGQHRAVLGTRWRLAPWMTLVAISSPCTGTGS